MKIELTWETSLVLSCCSKWGIKECDVWDATSRQTGGGGGWGVRGVVGPGVQVRVSVWWGPALSVTEQEGAVPEGDVTVALGNGEGESARPPSAVTVKPPSSNPGRITNLALRLQPSSQLSALHLTLSPDMITSTSPFLHLAIISQ